MRDLLTQRFSCRVESISYARVVQPGTKFFLRSSRRGRLRKKVTEKLEEKERGRTVRRQV